MNREIITSDGSTYYLSAEDWKIFTRALELMHVTKGNYRHTSWILQAETGLTDSLIHGYAATAEEEYKSLGSITVIKKYSDPSPLDGLESTP